VDAATNVMRSLVYTTRPIAQEGSAEEQRLRCNLGPARGQQHVPARSLETAGKALGRAAFEQAWVTGMALTSEAAMTLALSDLVS
jgi:hypothetical protein